jgi:hypothetical protein
MIPSPVLPRGWLAVAVVVVLVATATTAHHQTTLDADATLVETTCSAGEIDRLTVTVESDAARPLRLTLHTWDQRRHVRVAWRVDDDRQVTVDPGETRTITATAPTERARINNRSRAQVMLSTETRRTYLHFNTGDCS